MSLNIRVRSRAAALVLAVSLLVPSAGLAARDVPAAPRAQLSEIGIDNIGRVNANYFRGAAPDRAGYARLAAFGIKTIVDLRGEDATPDGKAWAEGAGMKYVQIPMTTHEPPAPSVIQEFLQLVDDPANQPVYVHCVGGRHRTGLMTALYRMTQDGWTADQAFQEMKQYRFGPAFLHPEFKRFVYAYRSAEPLALTSTR